MEYNNHWELVGKHAYLSPSGGSWVNYDAEKMANYYQNQLKKEEGTFLHDLASRLIKIRKRLPSQKNSFNQFVNDAIGLRMKSEIALFYSMNIFGTADALVYKDKEKHLQIHDLKTGVKEAPFRQLDIYSALFCLEYNKNPFDLTFEERIYQGVGYKDNFPDPEDIKKIMDKIVMLDQVIDSQKATYQGLFI